MMAAINFANTCMSAAAQSDCVAFACPAMTNIAIILDVSLLLASIIILPMIILVHHFPICRIPVQRPVSPSIL